MREFAAVSQGLTLLEPWDIGWVSEKLEQNATVSPDEEVRRYFPEHKVLAGLFHVVETLFGVRESGPTRRRPGTRTWLLPHR
ncbi:MAG: M3 family metallopeptidase [Rhodocyclaceae bacterium]|nr:M3 family metallopeptidase [Rhodocyclaceae bacterium]